MKKLIILPLLLSAIVLYAQTRPDTTLNVRDNMIESKLTEIYKQNTSTEIQNLKDKLDFQQKLNEQTVNSISSQLNAASYSLTIFGILFAVVAIVIGVYVTIIERKIVKISEENKALLAKSQKIKDDVEEMNKLIQSDIYNLYFKIKREETIHILDRLIKVPKDIANLAEVLLTRELQDNDFHKLRQAYFNLSEKDRDYKYNFKMLFFQHFISYALKDDQLRKEISEFIPEGIKSGFENDIIKSTSDFTTLLVDKGIQEFKSEINLFFLGLTRSQHSDYSEVYKLMFDNLKTRKNRFETFNVIENIGDRQYAKIAFGKLLLNEYSTDNPTESENLVFNEIKEYIAAQS